MTPEALLPIQEAADELHAASTCSPSSWRKSGGIVPCCDLFLIENLFSERIFDLHTPASYRPRQQRAGWTRRLSVSELCYS